MNDAPYTFDMKKNKNAFFRKDPSSISTKILKMLLVLIVFCLIVETIYYFIFLPITSNAKFVFDLRGTSLTEKEMRAMMGIEEGVKWAVVDSSKLVSTIISHPIIEKAMVRKKFPDKVFVEVVQRKTVAVSFVKINDDIIPLEIDKDGFVFRMGWNANTSKFMIVSGLNFKNPKLGMKVSRELVSFFNRLSSLEDAQKVLLNSISEIKINEKRYGDYDLILYPSRKKVAVLANKELTEKTLNRMILTLDVLDDSDSLNEIEYVDIRGENIVYKKKERNLGE